MFIVKHRVIKTAAATTAATAAQALKYGLTTGDGISVAAGNDNIDHVGNTIATLISHPMVEAQVDAKPNVIIIHLKDHGISPERVAAAEVKGFSNLGQPNNGLYFRSVKLFQHADFSNVNMEIEVINSNLEIIIPAHARVQYNALRANFSHINLLVYYG